MLRDQETKDRFAAMGVMLDGDPVPPPPPPPPPPPTPPSGPGVPEGWRR